MAEKPVRHKGAQPPAKKRSCMEFLDYWQPRIRKVTIDVEIDFSWRDHAITITDMRIPSALRTGVLYTQEEVEEGADRAEGDMNARVNAFLTQAARQH
jgi:hypothetical protein